MRKNTEISSEQFKEIINNFYNYFENGYVFEDFLKSYLEKIGLDEVYVTKRSILPAGKKLWDFNPYIF